MKSICFKNLNPQFRIERFEGLIKGDGFEILLATYGLLPLIILATKNPSTLHHDGCRVALNSTQFRASLNSSNL